MKAFRSCSIICVTLVFSLLAIVQAGAQGFGPGTKRLFTKHFQETLFDITKHADYSVEVILDEKEYKIGKDVIGIVVHDKNDSDVKGAELMIVHENLATKEIAPGTVTVTDKGNGLYIISGLDLHREGRWELSITVKKDGVEDRAKFILPDQLKQRVPKGRYSP
jgi:hypothetical protein